jgi:hypothetical protein
MGGNTASRIGLHGLVGGKFQLVMAAPADEREHAFTIAKLKLKSSIRVPLLPSADREQKFAK